MPANDNGAASRGVHPPQEFFEQLLKAIPIVGDLEGDLVSLHSARVALLASDLAARVLESNERRVFLAGLYHDVGANGSSAHPVRVQHEHVEDIWIRMHPIRAHHALSKSRELAYSAQIVLEHHEWVNGRGYPLGRRGPDILPEAQALRIADSLDMLMLHVGDLEDSMERLRERAGVEFDEDLVVLFEQALEETDAARYWDGSEHTLAELGDRYRAWKPRNPEEAARAVTMLFDLKKKSLRGHTERTRALVFEACELAGSSSCNLLARAVYVHELYTTYEPFRGAFLGGTTRREALADFPLVDEAFAELEEDPWVAELVLAACQLDQAVTISGEPPTERTISRALAALSGRLSPETLLLMDKAATSLLLKNALCA